MISKYVLEKDGQCAVLRGMRHVAPDAFYRLVQREIDEAAEQGYVFAAEGLHDDPQVVLANGNAKRIAKHLDEILGWTHSYGARTAKFAEQSKALRYPRRVTFDVDLSLQEVANGADERGLKLSRGFHWAVLLLAPWKVSDPFRWPLRSRVVNAIFGLVLPENWFGENLSAFWKRFKEVTIELRDQAIYFRALKRANGRNVFFVCGESHVPGLLTLFLADGWKVGESSLIDPDAL